MPYPDNMNDEAFERVWGDDPPEDTRNEDEVRDLREDAKAVVDKMMLNAHPDSILGCMAVFKGLLDGLNAIMQKEQNESVMKAIEKE